MHLGDQFLWRQACLGVKTVKGQACLHVQGHEGTAPFLSARHVRASCVFTKQ